MKKISMTYLSTTELTLYKRELKKEKKQFNKSKKFLEKFGFVIPVVVDKSNIIVIGDYFFKAAKSLGYKTIPTICVKDLSEADIKILRISYDRIINESEWNLEALKIEFEELEILLPKIDLTITGFEVPEIDIILDLNVIDDNKNLNSLPDNKTIPKRVKLGDLWILDDHLLLCGDSLDPQSYHELLGTQKAQLCFTDAPYNVKIGGHVCGKGSVKHEEFKMASGEMSKEEFTRFLSTAHENIAEYLEDGSIIFSCMDWRHIEEITQAAHQANIEMLNLCIWAKSNGGMGSLYRSQHELVFVFKKGKSKHINNIELGTHGRYRTNVWHYPGVNSFSRNDDLQLHPTVKPVEMVADAILDCSKINDLILDPFGGSGTTLIAAEKTKRVARLIELDPHYCDVILKRWEDLTGKKAQRIEATNKIQEKSYA